MKLDRSVENTIARIYSLRENEAVKKIASVDMEEEENFPRLRELRIAISRKYIELAKLRLLGQDIEGINLVKKELDELVVDQQELRKTINSGNRDVYRCSHCKDKGKIDGVWCKYCYNDVFREAIYEQSDYKELLKIQTFANFNMELYKNSKNSIIDVTDYENIVGVINDIKRYINDYPNNFRKNIILSGMTGVGKTFISSCIANELINKGAYVVYISATDLFEVLVKHYRSNDEAILMEKYISADILIIDDLGVESVVDGFTSNFLNLFDKRISFNKHTIISTNLSDKALLNRYSERFYSRMIKNYNRYIIYGNDFRMPL